MLSGGKAKERRSAGDVGSERGFTWRGKGRGTNAPQLRQADTRYVFWQTGREGSDVKLPWPPMNAIDFWGAAKRGLAATSRRWRSWTGQDRTGWDAMRSPDPEKVDRQAAASTDLAGRQGKKKKLDSQLLQMSCANSGLRPVDGGREELGGGARAPSAGGGGGTSSTSSSSSTRQVAHRVVVGRFCGVVVVCPCRCRGGFLRALWSGLSCLQIRLAPVTCSPADSLRDLSSTCPRY